MPRTNRALQTIICIGCFAGAFTATHLPASHLPQQAALNDKVVHFATFVALGAVTWWRVSSSARHQTAGPFLWTLAGVGAYAAFDEWTQPLVGRSCEWTDWLADVAGAVTGLALFRLVQGWKQRA